MQQDHENIDDDYFKILEELANENGFERLPEKIYPTDSAAEAERKLIRNSRLNDDEDNIGIEF